MRREVYNDDGDAGLVFVLGWGNRPEHENVLWLVERLIEADYRVTVFEIPLVVTDFETEYLRPVEDYIETIGEYRLLTHSTGGLIGAYLDEPVTRVDLSPWWGFHEDLRNPVVSLAMKLPLSIPLLPAGIEKSDLGDLATDRQIADGPDRAAPTFLREARRAQANMPPFDDDSVVFYTPEDPVVGADAIEARAPARNRVQYEGGHELFSSSVREDHIDTLLAAVDRGIDAL